MLETLSHLPLGQIVFLVAVVCAFSAFGLGLGFVYFWSNLGVSAPRRSAPASATPVRSAPIAASAG